MRSLLALLLVPTSALANPIGPPTGDLVLQFESEPSQARLDTLAARYGVQGWEPRRGTWPVYSALDVGPEPERAAFDLAAEPDVRWAEADRAITPIPDGAPLDDPLYPEMWHLHNTNQHDDGLPGADIGAPAAWEFTDGSGVLIAIHDSGVDLEHPDLRLQGTGLDIIDGDYVGSWEEIDDGKAHGTAVAGCAAAIGNNALGVAGVAHGATILPIRILGTPALGQPTTFADIYDAFAFSVDSGAAVINNSWGLIRDDCAPSNPISTFTAAHDYARSEGRGGLGTTVLWSAGNQGCDGEVSPWHSEPGVLAVGASNDRDLHIHYSTIGPQLDFLAPSGGRGGEHLWTTDITGEPGYRSDDYTPTFSGTSASAPVAAGVVALMIAANPRLRWDQVEAALCSTAARVWPDEAQYNVRGWSRMYGCGRIDAAAAVAAVSNVAPEPPRLEPPGAAGVRTDQLVLRWSDAYDGDGDALTYRVELSDGAGTLTVDAGPERRWDLRDALAPGTWTARLVAQDHYGLGEWSEPVPFRVLPVPEDPAPSPPAETGSGCAASVGGGAMSLLLLLPLAVRRRA